ncbi:glycerophosphoryl diester phosphodiesterase [Arthrobacter sp. VKM Ac-2550]|nr:glycerophosphoryl diester phosphodiesterase [Arthrobacter sp. VKM Ac-2550]
MGLAVVVGLIVLVTAVAIVVAAAIVQRAPADPPFAKLHSELLDHDSTAKIMIAAHRAQWRDYPENSLPAIMKAMADGADVVEIDVRLTADGVPVLMHDETVDRTTNGTGSVADLSLSEIKKLRLVEGLGGNDAAITNNAIPTLEEAMLAVRHKAFVNLDKGWDIRERLYEVLLATETVDHVIFKGSPDVKQAADFMSIDESILYMHIVDDATATHIGAFPERQPVAYEVVFNSLQDPQVQPAAVEAIRETSRIWVNSMWGSLAAGHTDEGSLRGANHDWNALVKLGATVLQTDNVEAMDFWRDGGLLERWNHHPGDKSIRVQAEDPVPGGQGVGYLDVDRNQCDLRPEEPMLDVCDNRGAYALAEIRGREWVKYSVDVKRSGTYQISTRVASDGPAISIMTEWDGEASDTFTIDNTTSLNAFERQPLETRHFEMGIHELTLRVPADIVPGLNIDYFQLDLLK